MADTKGSALATATPVATDIVVGVDDPSGTPSSKAFTVQSILDLASTSATYGVFPVRDYGALPDSGSDESTNIQSAIDAAEAAGGGVVLFEEGDYNIATGLTVNVSNVTLKGIGAQYPGNSGLGTGSRLLWTGTTSASHIMIDFTSPSGASAKKQYGGGLEGITVDCDAKAGYGIRVRSWQGGRLDRFAVVDPTTVGVQLEAYGSGTSLADPKDAQEWIIENFYVRIEAPSSGKGMRLTAGDDGNVSFNTFRQGIIWHDDGEGILIYNGDNNGFERVRTFLQSGGTGWSLSHGGNLAASSVVCDHNVFRDCYFQAKMTFKGTGSGFDGKAAGIKLIDLDASNSSATPTSTGSTVESGGSPILWRTSTQTTFTSTA